MKKTEILLLLFYRIMSGKTVQKSEFCCNMKITERSFYRYIGDLRAFCAESAPELEIVCDGDGNYFVKTNIFRD